MRWLALVLSLALLPRAAAAGLGVEDAQRLADALRVLRGGFDGAASHAASEVLATPDTADLTAFFGDLFGELPLNDHLAGFLGDRALQSGTPPPQRRSLQIALASAAARHVDAMMREELPVRFGADFAADTTRFEHLRSSMALLGRIAYEGDLPRETRLELYGRLRGLISSHPGVLRKEARIDLGSQPRLAALRAQLYKNLQDLLVPFERERFIADAGFSGDYAELVRNHGVLLLDNNGLDARQRRAIQEVLAIIPPELHRTRHISVHELLGNVVRGEIAVPLVGSPGVNLFDLSIGTHVENNFPKDVEPALVQTFCAVLQHELNHMVDAFAIRENPSLARRRDELVVRAGSDPRKYLRSTLPPGFFVTYPQEFFASISNAYFSDSFLTLTLALSRFEEGYREPLEQFLFFVEVYARGGDTAPFVVQDADCEFSLHLVPVGYDPRGRIDRISLPERMLRFEYDEAGNLLR